MTEDHNPNNSEPNIQGPPTPPEFFPVEEPPRWRKKLHAMRTGIHQKWETLTLPIKTRWSQKKWSFKDIKGIKLKELKNIKFKEVYKNIKESFQKNLNKESILKAIRSFDPQKTIDWITQTFQKRGAGFYGTLITIILSTFFIADLTALLAGRFIPEPPPVRTSRLGGGYNRNKSLNNYSIIFSRNLFNSQGLIPGDESAGPNSSDPGGIPVKSTLPLNLVGTLILSNELRSIATIEDKSNSTVYPVGVDDEIPNRIRVIKIEPRKVIFVNKSSNRREYIELPEDLQATNPILTPGRVTSAPVGAGVEKVAATQYNVSRSEVDKALSDFNNILTQARAVPNFENGVAAGYKLFQIVPGSIYDKLGLQNGDVISGLNGQPINDPAKAFEMLSELKTASHLELQVKKDGKPVTYTYDIR